MIGLRRLGWILLAVFSGLLIGDQIAAWTSGARVYGPGHHAAGRRSRGRWNPRLLGVRQKVVYGRDGRSILAFYLFEPRQQTGRPRPLVFYVHGGGLRSGTAVISSRDTSHNRLLVDVERRLIQSGVDFATVDYRLAPLNPWPVPLDDVKRAVRYVQVNHRALEVSSDRMVMMGDSAGGALSSITGLSMTDLLGQRPALAGVVDLFGPTDRRLAARRWRRLHGQTPHPVFGQYTPERIRNASPISYVHPGAPPFLIVQGSRDKLVPPEQSHIFCERLKQAGVPVQEIIVSHGGHELVPVGGPIRPNLGEVAQAIGRFEVNCLQGWGSPA